MTKSYNLHRFPDADYTVNDMGETPSVNIAGENVGEWELKDEAEKLAEIELDTINELPD